MEEVYPGCERQIQHILLDVDVTRMEEASYMLLMFVAFAVILLQSLQ